MRLQKTDSDEIDIKILQTEVYTMIKENVEAEAHAAHGAVPNTTFKKGKQ